MVFWKKHKKELPYNKSKRLATSLKGTANRILQDFNIPLMPAEIVMMHSLVAYMDDFLLKCFKGDKLVHTTWILARLIEARIILQVRNTVELNDVVNQIQALETAILKEKI